MLGRKTTTAIGTLSPNPPPPPERRTQMLHQFAQLGWVFGRNLAFERPEGTEENLAETIDRTVYYIDRVLRGARPAELAVELPSRYEFVVNLGTARKLGIKIAESLLLRADRVIE